MTREQVEVLVAQLERAFRGLPADLELGRIRRVLRDARYAPAAKAVYSYVNHGREWPTAAELEVAIQQGPPPAPVPSSAPRVLPEPRAVVTRKEHAAWVRSIRSTLRSGSSTSSEEDHSTARSCADEVAPSSGT